jgi:dTDP-4-amino-4,6-dideoxygalactose transaminase
MITNFHDITKQFEQALSDYTGSPYVIAVDNASNAIFISLMYEKEFGEWNPLTQKVIIPKATYLSVPNEIINAGGMVEFIDNGNRLKGVYRLNPTRVVDSALRFTADMYVPNTFMCISFTGYSKHFKLSKGGAILTDNTHFYEWAKKFRNSGRNECSYHVDNFTQIGINCYMMPEISARGLVLMNQFYNEDGSKKHNEDLELPYPDLSKFPIYTQESELSKKQRYINSLQVQLESMGIYFESEEKFLKR